MQATWAAVQFLFLLKRVASQVTYGKDTADVCLSLFVAVARHHLARSTLSSVQQDAMTIAEPA